MSTAEKLRETTRVMAERASVDVSTWDQHSNACLAAADELEHLEQTFDLRHASDQRAIEIWRGVTGNKLQLPSQDDLCVFLMMALDVQTQNRKAAEQRVESLTKALQAAHEAMEHMGDVLNGMDAVTAEDVERFGPTFDLVRAALSPMEGEESIAAVGDTEDTANG